jgi:threonylcarbamoyladenosine tRNA methylthiotransferase MtaB
MKKFAFYTLGCRANQAQTEVLKSRANQVVDFSEFADEYVINTCTVTQDADRKSRQAIRRAIRQNPKAKIIVTGCYAKLEAENLKKTFPEAEIKIFPSLVPRPPSPVPRIRMNLMIQDGCEHFCSYCIVPYARGKIKSKPLDQIVEESRQLVEAGAREIVLTGINLGTYQYDLSKVINLLSPIEKLLRIRISSLEPMYIDRKLIDTMARSPKVCKHLHIPLQSGDNSILKAMKRNYTRDDYIDLINYARIKMPDCGISTDIIVGFPGEGEKEFQNTVELVHQVKFSRIHIFSYSPRKGTPAADLPDQVDPKTKRKRSEILHELRNKYMQEFAERYLNNKVEILVEQKGEGLTSNFIRCHFNDPSNISGSLHNIFARLADNSGEIRG